LETLISYFGKRFKKDLENGPVAQLDRATAFND